MKTKKAQISELQPIIIALVSIGLVLAIGFLIMAEMQSQIITTQASDICGTLTYNTTSGVCYNSTGGTFAANLTDAVNGTRETVDAMADIPSWLPIIVITVIGSLLLGLVAFFKGR